MIGGVSRDTEAQHDRKGQGEILLFHGHHTRDADIQGAEAGNGVGDCRDHVVKRKHGVRAVIIACAVSTHHRAEKTEDENEVGGDLTESALGKRRQRQGDQLNAAKEKRQVVKPAPGVGGADADQHQLEKLGCIDENGGNHQHLTLLLLRGVSVFSAEVYGKRGHHSQNKSHEKKMLPGKKALRRPLISAKAKKFFQFLHQISSLFLCRLSDTVCTAPS